MDKTPKTAPPPEQKKTVTVKEPGPGQTLMLFEVSPKNIPTSIPEEEQKPDKEPVGVETLPDQVAALVTQGFEFKPVDYAMLVSQMEQRSTAMGKILKLAVATTLPEDWVKMGNADQGYNLYLMGVGAERVKRTLGPIINMQGFQILKHSNEDERGKFYRIAAFAMVAFAGQDDWQPVLGTASSRDAFFAVRYNKETKKDMLLPPSEVNENSVIQSALTDLWRQAVVRKLGLRGLPESYLVECGLDPKRFKSAEFGSNKDKTANDSPEVAEARRNLWRNMLILADADPKKASDLLVQQTTFKGSDGATVPGKGNIKDLTDKQIMRNAGTVSGQVANKLKGLGNMQAELLVDKVYGMIAPPPGAPAPEGTPK